MPCASLHLNRRLAADVYLGVAPVVRAASGWQVDGAGEALGDSGLEHALVMRRLPDGRDALSLLAAGALSPAHLGAAAERIAAFHIAQGLGVPAPFSAAEWRRRIDRPMQDNLATLRESTRATHLEYIQPKRVLRPSQATVRFETEPGKQLQSDWGEVAVEIAGQMRKVYFIVNELGYSRRFHFWCTDSTDAEHTYEGLLRSFEYFAGVTEEVLVDNQKSAVLQASNTGSPKFNERFVDLAGYYGFAPRACKPYRAGTKGKDERMVGCIKHNFFVRYHRFESSGFLMFRRFMLSPKS